MRKKVISLLMVVCLLAGLCAMPAAATEEAYGVIANSRYMATYQNPDGGWGEGRMHLACMEGKTVMPGLFDLHMHFNFDTVNVFELRARGESQALLNGISYGYQYLRNGYTTVRDCGCMYYLGVYLRDAYASGLLMGPRVITAGACNSPSAMGNSAFGPVYKEFNGPHEAWEVARTDIAAGADFVKYMVTGAVMNKGGDPGAMICTREELHVLSDVAKSLNTYVAAHCHGKEGIMACAEEEIGRNSVRPWIRPRTIASMKFTRSSSSTSGADR